MSELLMTHSEFESRHEDEAFHQRALEHHRQASYRAAHADSLDGYRAPREFPCPGVLRVVTEGRGPREVVCSSCSFETTIPAQRAVPDSEPAARADWGF